MSDEPATHATGDAPVDPHEIPDESSVEQPSALGLLMAGAWTGKDSEAPCRLVVIEARRGECNPGRHLCVLFGGCSPVRMQFCSGQLFVHPWSLKTTAGTPMISSYLKRPIAAVPIAYASL